MSNDVILETPELPGKAIQEAREAAGLTVKELAASVRISATAMTAIEEDRYDKLPGLPFVRGYLTNLQRELGMDQADVLDKFDHWRKDHPEGFQAPVSPFVDPDSLPQKPKAGRYTLFVLVAAIAVWLLPPAASVRSRFGYRRPKSLEMVVSRLNLSLYCRC